MRKFGALVVVGVLLLIQGAGFPVRSLSRAQCVWWDNQEYLWAQHDAYVVQCDARMKECSDGRGSLDFVGESSRNLLEVEVQLSSCKAERVAACAAHLERMRLVGKWYREHHFPPSPAPRELLAEAEHRLERAKAAPE